MTATLQALVLHLADTAASKISISSLIGIDRHHSDGRAVDIRNAAIAKDLLPAIATDEMVTTLSIDELIFDASVAHEADPNKWNYSLGKKHDYDAATLAKHKDHIHFAVTKEK